MAKELIINATLPEVRIALLEEGRIQELLIERQSEKGIVGNIYKGRVTRVLPGMQAAFVDVGLEKAAFLYVDDIYVHPAVMGEETEIENDSEGEEEVSPEGEGAIRAFAAPEEGEEIAAVTTVEQDDSYGEGEGDSSALDSHASEHAEQELTRDEMTQELHDAVMDQDAEDFDSNDESEEGDESDDSEDGEEIEDAEENDESEEDGASGAISAEGEVQADTNQAGAPLQALSGDSPRRRGRRRRRGRGRNGENRGRQQFAGGESHEDPNLIPDSVNENLNDSASLQSDRAAMSGVEEGPQSQNSKSKKPRPEFREQRGRDRRIKSKNMRPRTQANIADLLKEGQEVIVQVAKDPIATKGARLTCHVSLPGRHLVCMPSIDHVGVSRRIERDDERRRLRDFVEKNRPRKMGFIVRTASGGKDPESWIKQDIDYLSKLWGEIRTRADDVSAPSLVYEDLNSTLRAIRDWVNEDIDRIIVDTRYHYNELLAFAERFMPSLIEKIELYQGDIPVFDAYGLSSELTRSLERRVWLKSGGYIVIDQAEALVAIDVNTGRFVGKKNLEDTILKTNLEAAEEIAYQLRLRNCGGIIIVDFIDMEREENKMRVYRALDEALKKDRARPSIQKISELGLVEMTRKRTRDTLVRSLCEPCSHCEGRGYMKSNATVAYEILREIERLSVDREAKKILVSAHEAVINILAIELRDALDQLERRYNKSVYLQTVMEYHAEQFEVVSDRAPNRKQTVDLARQLRMERERSDRREKSKRGRDDNRSARGQDQERNQDRNQDRNRDQERNRDQDRNRDRNRDRDGSGNQGKIAPQLPATKPSGSFITTRAAPVVVEATPAVTSPEAVEGEWREPAPAIVPTDAEPRDFNDMDDEDQLAYLRAQAAQDAAIAGAGGKPPVNPAQAGNNGNGQRFGRGRNRNRNRGRGGGGGGNAANPNGGRFRPQSDRSGNGEPAVTSETSFDPAGGQGEGSSS
jgi:ribonuclease G